VNVLVEVAENENLIVVAYWLALKEFFRFLKGGLMLMNFICLGIEYKAVRDPSIITTEYQYL
jgi:hypothetical protein